MARGISLRNDYASDDLRALARSSKDGKRARRLLALSLIYDGRSRSEAARHGGVGLQTVEVRPVLASTSASGISGHRSSPRRAPRASLATSNPSRKTGLHSH